MPVDTMPIERFGISGFTKSNLKACFYNNRDCAAESSSEYYMFSGGDRITDGDDCVGGSKNVIRGFRITEDASCVDSDGYWGIDWYSDVSSPNPPPLPAFRAVPAASSNGDADARNATAS